MNVTMAKNCKSGSKVFQVSMCLVNRAPSLCWTQLPGTCTKINCISEVKVGEKTVQIDP